MKKPIDIDAMVAKAVPPRPNRQLAFTVDVRLVSEANQREHWRTKHSRKKKQQAAIGMAWADATWGRRPTCRPSFVRFIRVGPRRLDADNLAGSFKHVQAHMARELGIDDG